MKELGCRKELNAYTLCGDIGFNNKILLCDECDANQEVAKGVLTDSEDKV